ncbi:carboxypeptidase-like regulatory domain-containing protein [Pricia sp. S334]|uniref:Carboxypeptidase-like regulatory domain-containing protein n=1 Tax=Pricia mediterranea TaxID=3076079 RepID=A0ABU3L4I7_9FLAO|nr:carboxypeptidase-like regulatory domain-containing protein [Pricia sp. S334]MDT7828298.1 carboxypeptidase-like regulatory domain-containing protein [Pricia sp. S334]
MKNFIFLLSVMAFSISGIAQTSISGTVLEKETDQPLPGVSVLVKGTTKGTTTDFDGRYALDDIANDAVLQFSYLGFKTLEVAVTGQNTINASLETDAEQMDEVVVTAY